MKVVAPLGSADLKALVSVYGNFENAEAGLVRMDRKPGRIGFMSTQRRESRWQGCMGRAGVSGNPFLAPVARPCNASGGTAPTYISSWLATNSLQLEYRIVQLVQLAWLVQLVVLVPLVQLVQFALRIAQDKRRGSPPLGGRKAVCTPAIFAPSLSHIPLPSGLLRLHPSLPQDPAGRRRWAERYDGKRDLYLQHAA